MIFNGGFNAVGPTGWPIMHVGQTPAYHYLYVTDPRENYTVIVHTGILVLRHGYT